MTGIEGIQLATDTIRYLWNGVEWRKHPRGQVPLSLWGTLGSYQCGTFCNASAGELIRDCWGGPDRVRICQQVFTRQ